MDYDSNVKQGFLSFKEASGSVSGEILKIYGILLLLERARVRSGKV